MLSVGLTGGIGSGKSTVAQRLVERGATLIDSDKMAREVVEPGTEGLTALVTEFGDAILATDGSLDRAALAAVAFADERKRNALNGILHPLIRKRAAELTAAAPSDGIVVHDVPLLVETGMAAMYPIVMVVHADAEVRIRRLVEQRGFPESDARARITAQATDAQRRAVADVWIDNEGERAATVAAVDRVWDERLVPFEENLRVGRRAPRGKPVLVQPDPTWPAQAERVRSRVAKVAGDRAVRVEHIGSTAVPGLPAKDILDIQVVVADLPTAESVADELVAAGLLRQGGDWWDDALDGSKPPKAYAANADPARAVNCHVRPIDSPAWRETVLLRDWLREHPAAAAGYAQVKRQLAAAHTDVEAYADGKTPFLRAALDTARTWAEQTGWSVQP